MFLLHIYCNACVETTVVHYYIILYYILVVKRVGQGRHYGKLICICMGIVKVPHRKNMRI